jgi:hypothetical protein
MRWPSCSTHDGDFKARYLGIGFYKDLTGQRLLTSTAQMFDERCRGLILRGARARTDKGDRHPYLERNDAYDLVLRSVKAYRGHHGHAPARLVILKTSRFEPGEADGIGQAWDELQIDRRDLIWESEHPDATLVRDGNYPMLRGSFVRIGRDGCYSPAVAFRITGLTRDCASFNHCYCDRIHATRPCLSWRPRCWR